MFYSEVYREEGTSVLRPIRLGCSTKKDRPKEQDRQKKEERPEKKIYVFLVEPASYLHKMLVQLFPR